MKLLNFITLGLFTSVTLATAAPKIALVRVKDVYLSLPSTAKLQQDVKSQRENINKNERATQLRKIIGELQSLQGRLSDKNNPLDEVTNRKLARNFEIKRQEAQTLQQEFENFKKEQEKTINRKMVLGMRASLDKILATSQKIAREKGFDTVFDGSGSTNTGLAFVLYHKNAPDLTEDVQSVLKDGEGGLKPAAK
jgi:Skp family chaperone for outer membrane proteins